MKIEICEDRYIMIGKNVNSQSDCAYKAVRKKSNGSAISKVNKSNTSRDEFDIAKYF